MKGSVDDWTALSPSMDRLERIAQALGVPVSVFKDGEATWGRASDCPDDETAVAQLVEGFRAIESSALRAHVLAIVKSLAGNKGL